MKHVHQTTCPAILSGSAPSRFSASERPASNRRTFAVAAALALTLCATVAAPEADAQVARPARKGKSYAVQVTTAPEMAMVFLDDEKYGVVGVTPWKGKLVAGAYMLIIKKDGFLPVSKPINVDKVTTTFSVALEREIKPSFVAVTADSDPSLAGAQVRIDGTSSGSVPVKAQVPAGRHQVEVVRDGYEPFAQWVEVSEGQSVSLSPVLRKKAAAPGSLLIDANVPGAKASVDGKAVAQGLPAVVDDVTPGPHVVEVAAEGAPPWRETVVVVSGQRLKVTATLQQAAKTGSLLIDSDVRNVVVSLDGKRLAEAPPIVLDTVPVGPHAIEASADGQSWAGTVTVVQGERAKVMIELQAKVQAAAGQRSAVEQAAAERAAAKAQADKAAADKAAADKAAADKAAADKAAADKAAAEGAGRPVAVEREGPGDGEAERAAAERAAAERAAAERAEAERAAAAAAAAAAPAAPPPTALEQSRTRAEQARIDQEEFQRLDTMMKTPIGARTLPSGFFALELSGGYPHYLHAQATVGIAHEGPLKLDAALFGRSFVNLTEGGLQLRLGLAQGRAFAASANARIGGGKGMGGRNSFLFGAGVVGSLVLRETVTLSGHLNIDAWSERLCAEATAETEILDAGSNFCRGKLDTADTVKAKQMLDAAATERDSGAMFTFGTSIEIRINEWMNVHGLFTVAPGQEPRAGYSGLFQDLLIFDSDPGYFGRIGVALLF